MKLLTTMAVLLVAVATAADANGDMPAGAAPQAHRWAPAPGPSGYPGAGTMAIPPQGASAPVSMAPGSYASAAAAIPGSPDHIAAALVTLDDLRKLVSHSDRLRQVASDPLTRQFLKERVTSPDISSLTGLSSDYLNWLFDMLMSHGDRIGADVVLPNFRLLAPDKVPSWPQVWARSFAPTRPSSSGSGGSAAAYRGAESLIAWRDTARADGAPAGRYTPFGWVYPRSTQHLETR